MEKLGGGKKDVTNIDLNLLGPHAAQSKKMYSLKINK